MIKRLEALSTLLTKKVNRVTRQLTAGQCINCLAAGAPDGLCPPCREELPSNRWHCHCCGLPFPFPVELARCGQCLQQPPGFSRTLSPWRYQFPVDRMIHRYKYSGQRPFALPLIRGLASYLDEQLAQAPDSRPELIIPAPMDPVRRRKRGFNQAEDIAEQLSLAMAIPYSVKLVTRHRQVAPQRGLNRQQRLANLNGVFRVQGTPPSSLAIVDDVVTTGATVRALATALREAGAEDIQVWALARTPG